jgi:hypothetical protein
MSLLDKYNQAQASANSVSDASKQSDKYVYEVAAGKTALTAKSAGTNASIYSPVAGTTNSNNDYVNKAFQASKL